MKIESKEISSLEYEIRMGREMYIDRCNLSERIGLL